MRLIAALTLMSGMLLLAGSGVYSQTKDAKDNPPAKMKGRLPPGWGKLELSADQKATIYKVQSKYQEEIAKLKAKIEETEAEEKQEMVKVLTADQKKKLQELATGETTPKK